MSQYLLGGIITRQWSCIVIVAHLLHFFTLINIGECLIDPAPDPVGLPSEQDLLVFDPTRNITCLGAHTEIGWNLDLVGTHVVRPIDGGRSMQELCAHPTYGGKVGFPNFGGYCHEGDFFFSKLHEVEILRSYLECRNRCFCNHGLQDPKQQPKLVAETRKTFQRNIQNSGSRYVMALDRRIKSHNGFPHLLTRLYGKAATSIFRDETNVGITPGNNIQCGGPLPTWRLPDGFDQHDFASNQALCATQLAGGNPAANAGAYCHRVAPTARNERVISFADDQTPRLSWTWDGENGGAFLFSAAVRFHCWKNCICQNRNKLKNYLDPQVRMWQWMMQAYPQLHIGKGNKYPMGSSTDSKGKQRTSSRGANNPTNQCAASPDKPGTCTTPWPSDILGPLPKALELEKLVSVNPPPVETWDQGKTCGNVCSDYNDCGGDCLCRLPSGLESRAHGWDVVGKVTRCMDVASVFG